MLPVTVSERLAPTKFDVLTETDDARAILEMLDHGGAIDCRVANPFVELPTNAVSLYDAVISCPPFGAEPGEGLSIDVDGTSLEVRDSRGHLAILLACLRLRENGVAACVVTPNFLLRSGQKGAKVALETLGFRVRACIEIPSGTFHPFTQLHAYLLILERSETQRLFSAQYSQDVKHQETVRANFTDWVEGARAAQGCLVDASDFRGFAVLAALERVQSLAKRMDTETVQFGTIVAQVNRPKAGKAFVRLPEKPNSVYLPTMAQTRATTSQERLPDRLKSYLQIVLREDVANAPFVAGLLNTSLGQAIRDVARTGTTIRRIDHRELLKAPFLLPPLVIQEQVVSARARINRLQAELNELETILWRRPMGVRDLESKLSSVNKADRFQDWMETLPFPLASILWRYHAHKGSPREKYERLLSFFEALAEFAALVHLSAFSSNESLWIETRAKLQEKFDEQNLSFKLATFGLWKLCAELLTSNARRILKESPDLCFEIYRTHDRRLLEALFSKPLLGVFQETNAIRNTASGHVGAVSDATAKRTLSLLTEQLSQVRDVFGDSWRNYELVRPLECRVRSGIFHYDAQRIVGTRSMPFETTEIEVTEAMDDGRLHLWSPAEDRTLMLLPLIRIMASPQTEQTACYFYNRRQPEGIRFLSYHFEAEPDLVQSFEDTATALDLLAGDTVVGQGGAKDLVS